MVKIIGCILIVAASTAVGFVFAENLKKRLLQLKELQRSIFQLENEIVYTYTALPEAFLNISLKSTGPVKDIFNGVSESLTKRTCDSVYDAFKDALEASAGSLDLTKADASIILDLSKALGKSDMNGHKSIFSLAKVDLEKKIEEAETLMAKNTKMYRYLGFSFGAVVAILLI